MLTKVDAFSFSVVDLESLFLVIIKEQTGVHLIHVYFLSFPPNAQSPWLKVVGSFRENWKEDWQDTFLQCNESFLKGTHPSFCSRG